MMNCNKKFHPYFELFYFRHGKAVCSAKLSKAKGMERTSEGMSNENEQQNLLLGDK